MELQKILKAFTFSVACLIFSLQLNATTLSYAGSGSQVDQWGVSISWGKDIFGKYGFNFPKYFKKQGKYALYTENTYWNGTEGITPLAHTHRPNRPLTSAYSAGVAFDKKGLMYIAYTDYDSKKLKIMSGYSENELFPLNNAPNHSSKGSPEVVVHKNSPIIAFRKSGKRNYIYITKYENGSWKTIRTPASSATGVSMHSDGKKIYMAYRGSSTKYIYYMTSTDGIKWSKQTRIGKYKTSNTPDIVANSWGASIVYKGSSTNNIYILTTNNWRNWKEYKLSRNARSNRGPAFDGNYVYFKGISSNRIYKARPKSGNNWNSVSTQTIGNSKSSSSLRTANREHW